MRSRKEKEKDKERAREVSIFSTLSHLAQNHCFNSLGDGALNLSSLSPSSASTEWNSIIMTQSRPNQKHSERDAGSEGDDSSPSSSPRPPPSPWATASSATTLPSLQPPPPAPPPPRPQPQCNPTRLACEIQACFKRRGFEDPSRCSAQFEALKRCCETLTEESLHCSSDWQKK